MAFFDSPKNRALWERELVKLNDVRNKRKATGFRPPPVGRKGKKAGPEKESPSNPYVRHITFKELMEIEAEAQKRKSGGGGRKKKHRRQKDTPERSKRAALE